MEYPKGRVRADSIQKYRHFAVIWLSLVAIHVAVKFAGLKRVRQALSLQIALSEGNQQSAEYNASRAAEMGRQVKTIKRRMPKIVRGNCLSQSLALWWLLARMGIGTTLQIGAHRDEGEFKAHAWVEYNGQPINAKRRVREKYQTFDHNFTAPAYD